MTISSRSPRVRWKFALAAVPMVLLLAGCRSTASYTIHADDTVTIEVDQGLSKEEADAYADQSQGEVDVPTSGQDVCDYMKSDDDEQEGLAVDITYAPYENKGGMYGCVAKGTATLEDASDMITRDGDVFTFTLDNSADTGEVSDDAKNGDFSITVTFPGKVLSNKGGTVKGNSVTWTGFDEVNSLLEATGSAKPSSNMMMIILIVGGVVVVGAIVAVVIVVTRKKKPAPAAQPGQYPGQYPGQQYPGQYPQQGQPQQYPGQPQQYPGQPGQYPQQGQPQQYPGQPQQYPGQPGQQMPQQYPGQQGQPGQYPPGQQPPYPGQ